MKEYYCNLIISSHDPVVVPYNERIFSQNKSTPSHEYLFEDGAKCSLSWSSLFKQASFFTRLEKDELVRIFCIYIRSCSIVALCLISYSICLQTIETLPYRLCCLFSHFVACSDSPVTNLITIFSICSTCHSAIGKLFCIKKDHIS